MEIEIEWAGKKAGGRNDIEGQPQNVAHGSLDIELTFLWPDRLLCHFGPLCCSASPSTLSLYLLSLLGADRSSCGTHE